MSPCRPPRHRLPADGRAPPPAARPPAARLPCRPSCFPLRRPPQRPLHRPRHRCRRRQRRHRPDWWHRRHRNWKASDRRRRACEAAPPCRGTDRHDHAPNRQRHGKAPGRDDGVGSLERGLDLGVGRVAQEDEGGGEAVRGSAGPGPRPPGPGGGAARRGRHRQIEVHHLACSASRSFSPPWRSIRFRLALRTYAPRGVRVVSQTKSRKIPTRNITALFREQHARRQPRQVPRRINQMPRPRVVVQRQDGQMPRRHRRRLWYAAPLCSCQRAVARLNIYCACARLCSNTRIEMHAQIIIDLGTARHCASFRCMIAGAVSGSPELFCRQCLRMRMCRRCG